MRIPRFTIVQLFLAATLIALVLGLVTSANRESPDDGIAYFTFSPSGQHLAVLHVNGTVRIWQIAADRPRLVAQTQGSRPRGPFEMYAMDFLDDDRVLKVECVINPASTWLLVLNVRTGRVSRLLKVNATLARTQDGQAASPRRFVIADFITGDLLWYDLVKEEFERRIPLAPPNTWPALRMSGRGNVLAAIDQANTVYTFDVESGQPLRQFPDQSGLPVNRSPGEPPGIVALNHEGTILALPGATQGTSAASVVLFDPASGSTFDTLSVGLNDVYAIAFSRDGQTLAVSDGTAIECYQLKSKELIRRIELGSDQKWFIETNQVPRLRAEYSRLALSPDGMKLAAFQYPMSDQISVWDLSHGGEPAPIGRNDWRLVSVLIFTMGFALWAAAWGVVRRRNRQAAGFPEAGRASAQPFWRRVLIAACCLGAFIRFAELTTDEKIPWGNVYSVLSSYFYSFLWMHVIALALLPCLLFFLVCLVRSRKGTGAGEGAKLNDIESAGTPHISSVAPSSRSAPLTLKLCWSLMFNGGIIALLIPIGMLFFGRSGLSWTGYVSFVVGILAISRAASCDTVGLGSVLGLQAINVISCDVMNLTLAGFEFWLLRRPRVKAYLQQPDLQ